MYEAIMFLFPAAVVGRDFSLRDDGAGPYIVEWNLEEPQPTAQELAASMQQAQALAAAKARKVELLNELIVIDAKSTRPLRAIAANTASAEDRQRLAALEAAAAGLRTELAALGV